MQQEKILITSALPYANGPLHFGHLAGAYLPGDCYARFERLQGSDVLYLCGSDEYGVAITLSAEMAGRSPKEHIDLFHGMNSAFFERLNFSFDHYSRTSWEGHTPQAHQFFLDLFDNGFIEEQMSEQLYSEEDKRFLADRYVIGICPKCGFNSARGDECQKCGASYDAIELKEPRSKLTNAPLQTQKTRHWFLRLDKFKERLSDWINQKNWKPNVTNFVKKYIDDLKPRAITRDIDWGIPVPLEDAKGKVIYVWFDAPIGYISAAIQWAEKIGEPEKWKEYWCDEKTKLVNFIGKDNIPFHAVIFPAMLMGQNQPYKLVDELPANEFLNLEGRQFSKSDGWTIDLERFFESFSTDQIRYTLAANAPENSDSEFTWKDFQARCNGELLSKYGNLVNRTMVFIQKHYDGLIPPLTGLQEEDHHFLEEIKTITEDAKKAYKEFKLRKATQCIMELAQAGNVYFDKKKPWKAETKEAKGTTLACCLECLKAMALISSPVIPETAQKLWNLMTFDSSLETLQWDNVLNMTFPIGKALPKPAVLFSKIEDSTIQTEIDLLKSSLIVEKDKEPPPPLKEEITFDEFSKLDLRIGKVIAAEKVPKSKKLLVLTVDIGIETRSIVSGISQHYSPEEILGSKVVVVANLKPAKLMGIPSEGMILAGSFDDSLSVLQIEDLPIGTVIS